MGVRGEERHLTFRIATIGTVRVRLDKFPDGEAICGFFGGDAGLHGSDLAERLSYVQDTFTIRPIAIRYQNGIASSEIFRGGRRGAALRARRPQAARGSARALPTDSGFGGRTRLQAVRTPVARREIE